MSDKTIAIHVPFASGSTSKLLAFSGLSKTCLEVVSMGRDGRFRSKRNQDTVLSGELVRLKGLGDNARPMRFSHREGGSIVLSILEVAP